MELTSGPLTYTVEEAAQLLRIGRRTAYAWAKEWRATGGLSTAIVKSPLVASESSHLVQVDEALVERRPPWVLASRMR
jgi:transposase